jgi:hypothetical protein
MKKKTVDAIYDDDLLEFLDRLELKNKFLSGQLTCAFCGDVISWDNLHSVFPDSGTIKLCCSKPECINRLISKVQKREN